MFNDLNRVLIIFSVFRLSSTSPVSDAFLEHELVPDCLKKAPEEFVSVVYPSGVEVNLGNVLTPRQVKDQPKVRWDAKPDTFYTLCMTVPYPETLVWHSGRSTIYVKYREWQHWLIGNIRGNDISTGDVIAPYLGAGPPNGTGLQRFVFLVYKQDAQLVFEEDLCVNTSVTSRPFFKIQELSEKYYLDDPIAGNFFRAEWDEYVPELLKKLDGPTW